MRIEVRQIGPGMVQQMQRGCDVCDGTGEAIDPKNACRECNGKKVVSAEKVLEVPIEKGMKHGTKIPFLGEGDERVSTLIINRFFLFWN